MNKCKVKVTINIKCGAKQKSDRPRCDYYMLDEHSRPKNCVYYTPEECTSNAAFKDAVKKLFG